MKNGKKWNVQNYRAFSWLWWILWYRSKTPDRQEICVLHGLRSGEPCRETRDVGSRVGCNGTLSSPRRRGESELSGRSRSGQGPRVHCERTAAAVRTQHLRLFFFVSFSYSCSCFSFPGFLVLDHFFCPLWYFLVEKVMKTRKHLVGIRLLRLDKDNHINILSRLYSLLSNVGNPNDKDHEHVRK